MAIPEKTRLPYRTQPYPPALHPSLWGCTGFALAQCARAGDTLISERLAPLGITPPEFAILLLIDDEGPLPQARLGDFLAIDKATVVSLVDALEHAGLATRRPNPNDARSVVIQLQGKAKRIISKALQAELEAKNLLTATLDDSEKEMLHTLLCKVAQGLGLLAEGSKK